MSIIRGSDPTPSTSTDITPPRGDPAARRAPPAVDAVSRFRELMMRGDGQASAQGAAAGEDGSRSPAHDAGEVPRDAAAAFACGDAGSARADERALSDTLKADARERRDEQLRDDASLPVSAFAAGFAPPATTAAGDAPPAPAAQASVADLIERHVRQMAVGEGGDEDRVFLRMNDDTLPGTDLLLTRTPGGWALQADVRSRGSYEAIRDAAPELARRFAARNLGTLVVDPRLHG